MLRFRTFTGQGGAKRYVAQADLRNNENVVTSGPFKRAFKNGEHVILERYDGFFMEGRPYLDKVVWLMSGSMSG